MKVKRWAKDVTHVVGSGNLSQEMSRDFYAYRERLYQNSSYSVEV